MLQNIINTAIFFFFFSLTSWPLGQRSTQYVVFSYVLDEHFYVYLANKLWKGEYSSVFGLMLENETIF